MSGSVLRLRLDRLLLTCLDLFTAHSPDSGGRCALGVTAPGQCQQRSNSAKVLTAAGLDPDRLTAPVSWSSMDVHDRTSWPVLVPWHPDRLPAQAPRAAAVTGAGAMRDRKPPDPCSTGAAALAPLSTVP